MGVFYWDLLRHFVSNNWHPPQETTAKHLVDEYSKYILATLLPVYYGNFSYHFAASIYEMCNGLGGVRRLLPADLSDKIRPESFKPGQIDQVKRLVSALPDEFWLGVVTTHLECRLGVQMFNEHILPKLETRCRRSAENVYSDIADIIADMSNCESGKEFLCRYLHPENEAVFEFCRSRFFMDGDIDRTLNILWDCGLNLGCSRSWRDATKSVVRNNRLGQDDRIHEILVQLTSTVDDFISKSDVLDLFTKGSRGELIRIFKTAIRNDFIDRKREKGAIKRQGIEIPFSQLMSSKEDGLPPTSEEETLMKIAHQAWVESDTERIESRVELGIIQKQADLSLRERQALMLMTESVLNDDGMLTYEQLGFRMGVTKGTAKVHFTRACKKLRRSRI